MTTVYRLAGDLRPDSAIIGELVRVWRDAREARLRFLSDLHDADEDRAYLSGVVLPANEVWVATADGATAGFIAFAPGWVNHLYVAPAFQGRGVGTALLAIATLRNERLQLWAFEVNGPAIRFYVRRGFRVAERTDGASNEARRPDVRLEWER
jgi:GNAT superfamily N-acetyltransferase